MSDFYEINYDEYKSHTKQYFFYITFTTFLNYMLNIKEHGRTYMGDATKTDKEIFKLMQTNV